MPKQKAIALISELNDRFADPEPSVQQQQLLDNLEHHIHDLNEDDVPDPEFLDALEVLMAELEVDHPALTAVVRNLSETLKNIGV